MTWWWSLPLLLAAGAAATAHVGAHRLRRELASLRSASAAVRKVAAAAGAGPRSGHGGTDPGLRSQPQPLGFPRV